jgi:hypothetical protein
MIPTYKLDNVITINLTVLKLDLFFLNILNDFIYFILLVRNY